MPIRFLPASSTHLKKEVKEMVDKSTNPQKDIFMVLPELKFITSKDPLDPNKKATSTPGGGQQKEELVHRLIDRINKL
jgi:hypothetical protein